MNPALTAILMMPHSFERLAVSVSHLRLQTVRERIEVILVHAPGAAADLDEALFAGFHSFRRFELPGEFVIAEGFALAFQHATAPVVAYIEDHVTINPGWAEAILDAHAGPWAAVAPAMENGSHARSLAGRTSFLMSFVEWYGLRQRQEIAFGPGHNTTYKRAVLEPHAARLGELYRSERNLCYLLEAEGHKMVVEPRAVTRHMNISLFRPAMAHGYCGGKIFGAHRAASMTGVEKIIRTLIAPVVPLLRLWRVVRILVERKKCTDIGLVATLPCLMLGLSMHAVGEVAGYWGDARAAERAYREFELNRLACVDAIDRTRLLPPSPTPQPAENSS